MKEYEPKQLMISDSMVLRRTSCLLSKAENEYIIIAAGPVFGLLFFSSFYLLVPSIPGSALIIHICCGCFRARPRAGGKYSLG